MNRIKELIYSQFETESACAKALGWPRQRLNKISKGYKVPTVKEVNELSKVLKMPVGDLASIFLQIKSPNRQQN